MFCPKCGSLLIPKKEDTKRLMVCSCGYKETSIEKAKIKEVVRERADIEVVTKDASDMLPLTEADCPKCGNDKAYYWLTQTRASDEPETKFMRCQRCKHTWRDYS